MMTDRHEETAPPPDGGSEPDDRQIILAVRRGWAKARIREALDE